MAGPSWLVDSSRIATKIKSSSGYHDPQKVAWTSNPTRHCPNCNYLIDNNDVSQYWPGLPGGVKFDPTDQELILHLMSKVGVNGLKPHPFLEEFIPTVEQDDGICYTHPKNLPGVTQNGGVSHFFHRAIKAYSTGNRKRRKIHDNDFRDVRWHKTGRTKPVIVDGVQRGCKKIMVLYGGKNEKTNWVMHQYHLGTEEDEKERDYVISKIFYQQQQPKLVDKIDQDLVGIDETGSPRRDPITPKSVTPEPVRAEKQYSAVDLGQDDLLGHRVDLGQDDMPGHRVDFGENCETGYIKDQLEPEVERPITEEVPDKRENETADYDGNNAGEEDPRLWESGSQYVLDSQQLVEALSLCEDLLESQSPNREENADDGAQKNRPRLSDYAKLGKEHFKKDLEECQNLVLDPSNIELDTPPEFRLSQLEFGSQDSFLSFGTEKNVG